MKSDFHFHFYSRIFISLLIFAFGFFLLQQSVSTTAQVSPADDVELTGWAWSEKAGWISLSCNNDFDGDGVLENACLSSGGIDYGLRVRHIASDPDTPYIQGCAWAGNPLNNACSDTGLPCENNLDCSAPATCNLTPAGWLCFSDPVGLSTNAPTNGIPIRQIDWQEQYSMCGVAPPGHCSGDNSECTSQNSGSISFASCKSNEWCIHPLFQGICYDYLNTADYPELPDPSTYDPYNLPGNWSTLWDVCYHKSPCPNSGEECVYPQVNGRGECSVSGTACTYDTDCGSAENCIIQLDGDFIESKECTSNADCSQGYQCVVGEVIDYVAYPNALEYSILGPKATWLKIVGSGGALGDDLVGFPIQTKLYSGAEPGTPEYDEDNPDLSSYYSTGLDYSGTNPINGCFNCYEEKTMKCSPYYTNTCTSSSGCVGVCNDGFCSNNSTKPCTKANESSDCKESCEVRDVKNKCANCLEYFYYKDEKVKRCHNKYQTPCNTDADCLAEGADYCTAYPDNYRCSNNNQYYCVSSTDPDTCSEGRCVNTPTLECSTNNDCILSVRVPDCGTCNKKTVGDLEKVLAGYNCAGDTKTIFGATVVGSCTVQNMDNSCTLNAYNQNINSCGSCEAVFKTTGVMLDNKHNSLLPTEKANLCGWAQNPAFGWINFSPRITTSTKPYFSVEQGNIYSKSRIVTLYHPPFGKFNASYLIESGGSITNFVSDATTKEKFQGELADRPLINFLSLTNPSAKYTNALGKLDYKGLITVAKTVSGIDYNKYGGIIKEEVIASGVYADNAIFSNPFNNKVFHVTNVPDNFGYGVEFGNGVDLSVKCGDASFPSGAGVIVVEGNMKIKNNIRYDSSCTINNLKQIPSLVWIVKGDVMIDATTVSEVAGTFIILGDGNVVNGVSDCSKKIDVSPYQPLSRVGCGQFKSVFIESTGAPWHPDDFSLTVSGNVLARNFVLARTKTNTSGDPAEKFINDGRLQSNPPLGLTDMSKVIPRFSSY